MSEPVNLNQILKEHKGPDGLSLFEHLSQLVEKIVHDKEEGQKYDNFEQISSFLKRNSFGYKAPKTDKEVNKHKDYTTALTHWYGDTLHIIDKIYKENSHGRKEVVRQLGVIQNFVADSKILEQAGISFGEEETLILHKSLQKLAARTNARELRFWGKIFGTKQDYFIAEGLLNYENADEPPTPDSEPAGFGCNRLTFWVVNNVLDDWLELPLVTPKQIQIARKIKHVFTGDLNATLNTYPAFPGKEKHYLRAQLVRISHNCTIAPAGMRKTNDDDPKKEDLEIPEDAKYPGWDAIVDVGAKAVNLGQWVHLNQNILEAGRVRHYVPPTVKEDEREEYENNKANDDPYEERLKAIEGDVLSEKYKKDFNEFLILKNFGSADNPDSEKLWKGRVIGDPITYNGLKEEGVISYAVAVLKNVLWPGAQTVASVNGYVNIYVGYGHKLTTPVVDPACLGATQDEPQDVEEHPEPCGNPKQPEAPKDDQAGDNQDGGDNGDGDGDGQD